MRNLICFLLFLGMHLQNAQAVVFPPALPEAASKIGYVAQIPFSVLNHRPRAGITRFYGLTNVNGQKLAFHLYDLKEVAKNDVSHNRRSPLQLDIFAVHTQRTNTTFTLLNSAECHLIINGTDKKLRFELAALWLDPKNQKQPIVLARRTNLHQNGWDTNHIFFCFPNGFSKRAQVETFATFRSLENFQSSQIKFDCLDEAGRITILIQGNQDGDVYSKAFKWNGKKFSQYQERYDYYSDPIYYVWDGKKFIEKDMSKETLDKAK